MFECGEHWGEWIICTHDCPAPFRVGDYIQMRSFIDGRFHRSCEDFIKDGDFPFWAQAVDCLRPGRDRIEIRIRRPRGMRILSEIIENLPVQVVHE